MDKEKTKILFMGTPEISAEILVGLINDGFNIIGVITEPDKPVGKKQELLPTPVRKFAQDGGLEVFQPEKKADVLEVVKKLAPDLVIVAAYGKILTKEILEAPKYGCINFHASLLPQLRGASPVQGAILQGLDKTGVTIMTMDEGMDTGATLSSVEVEIDKKETTTTLLKKLLEAGLPLLLKTIPEYVDGIAKPKAQDETKATYCSMIKKEDGKIEFNSSAEKEERKIRAYDIWPGVYCFWEEKRLKIIEASSMEQAYGAKLMNQLACASRELGKVFLDVEGRLCINFSEGFWIVEKLQLEGKNAMSANDFLNGNKNIIGAVLK